MSSKSICIAEFDLLTPREGAADGRGAAGTRAGSGTSGSHGAGGAAVRGADSVLRVPPG